MSWIIERKSFARRRIKEDHLTLSDSRWEGGELLKLVSSSHCGECGERLDTKGLEIWIHVAYLISQKEVSHSTTAITNTNSVVSKMTTSSGGISVFCSCLTSFFACASFSNEVFNKKNLSSSFLTVARVWKSWKLHSSTPEESQTSLRLDLVTS